MKEAGLPPDLSSHSFRVTFDSTHLLHAALKIFCKLGSTLLSISIHTAARVPVGEVSVREGLDFTAENSVVEIDSAKPKNPGKG
jgi:hypothetical protein